MVLTTDVKVGLGMLFATVLIIGGAAYFSSQRAQPAFDENAPTIETSQLVTENSPKKGPVDAKVTVVEFGDFECPSCGSLHPVLKQLEEKYKDQSVQFVFRHFPLAQHEHAFAAAEAASEAQAQGKFWEYHDLLFTNQNNLTRADLEKYAEQLSLDLTQFRGALDEKKHSASIQTDIAAGQAIGVRGTPTLFINGQQFTGQYSASALSDIIDAGLQ